MSILLPSERLSFLSLWVSEFLRSLELCDRSLSLLVELALLPSPQRVIYEHAAPFWASEFPHSEEWFLRSPELLMGRASTAPLTTEGHLWACRSLMGVWVPSHSEEWVLRPPELALGPAPFVPYILGPKKEKEKGGCHYQRVCWDSPSASWCRASSSFWVTGQDLVITTRCLAISP